MKKTREELGFYRDGKLLIIDDVVEIPDEIGNMSEEELDAEIAILEAKTIEEGRNIPEPELLVV